VTNALKATTPRGASLHVATKKTHTHTHKHKKQTHKAKNKKARRNKHTWLWPNKLPPCINDKP